MDLLSRVNGPEDLKKLSLPELYALAGEIRKLIIHTCAKNGGHLASSLGAVELSIALHYVFNSPEDVIILDVGHQAYAHKIVTSRKDKFHTLRQYGGISGFTSREESPHDPFGAGHSSTSISAALGIIEGKRLKGRKGKAVAVIGDGSMTGGMAFEALNQAGYLGRDIIVVLNDNEMSISPNVGALQSFISRKITDQSLIKVRKKIKEFIKSLPGIGEDVYHVIKKAEDSVVSFFTQGIVFEGLGFHYLGPIDGHRLEHLIETFEHVAGWEGPILVHVVTKKGKGYAPAEADPERFHGVAPFDISTGEPLKKNTRPTYSDVFGKTLVQLAVQNSDIVAITAAMTSGTGLHHFQARFPDRFYDVGIAEQHAVTFAGGLATQGLRPVVAIYSTFLQRAFDQIVHDVCLQNLPVLFAVDRAGIVGEDGATHQGLLDIPLFNTLPNLVIMAPSGGRELASMLATGLTLTGPSAVRYPRGLIPDDFDPEKELPPPVEVGKSRVLSRGRDITIIALGHVFQACEEAAEELEKKGVSVRLIDARFVRPLDEKEFLTAARRTRKILIVEEGVITGGFGRAVEALIRSRKEFQNVKILVHGLHTPFVPHGNQEKMRALYQLDAKGILNQCYTLLKG